MILHGKTWEESIKILADHDHGGHLEFQIVQKVV